MLVSIRQVIFTVLPMLQFQLPPSLIPSLLKTTAVTSVFFLPHCQGSTKTFFYSLPPLAHSFVSGRSQYPKALCPWKPNGPEIRQAISSFCLPIPIPQFCSQPCGRTSVVGCHPSLPPFPGDSTGTNGRPMHFFHTWILSLSLNTHHIPSLLLPVRSLPRNFQLGPQVSISVRDSEKGTHIQPLEIQECLKPRNGKSIQVDINNQNYNHPKPRCLGVSIKTTKTICRH